MVFRNRGQVYQTHVSKERLLLLKIAAYSFVGRPEVHVHMLKVSLYMILGQYLLRRIPEHSSVNSVVTLFTFDYKRITHADESSLISYTTLNGHFTLDCTTKLSNFTYILASKSS